MRLTKARGLQTCWHQDLDAFGNKEHLMARCKLVPQSEIKIPLQQPPSLAYSTNNIKADSWVDMKTWEFRVPI